MISRALVVAPSTLGTGGLGRAAEEFLDGMTAAGVHTEYVGAQRPDTAVRFAASRGVRRLLGASLHRRAQARSVRRAVPATGWELVYAIAGSAPVEHHNGLCVIHQSTRYPAVEWEATRGGERETGGRGDFSRLERRRRERELRSADLVHVTTRSVMDEFLEAGFPPERLVHAYLGVDLERFWPNPKPQGLRIAFVGPLSMRKGVDVVAELAEQVSASATVSTVGGPTYPWSRRIVDGARFEPRASVPELLAEAHALVLPSRSDAFAYVVLEALATGTIPFVTPEVGAAEIVRRLDPRLVVERSGFAERVVDLLGEVDLAALAPRAVELAQEFDRRVTGRRAAEAVLQAAEELVEVSPGEGRRRDRAAPRIPPQQEGL